MLWLQKTIQTLNPDVVLEGSPWREEWESNQRAQFVRVAKVLLPIVALGYIVHYPLFDVANGLEPLEAWLAFRISAAVLVLLALGLYFTPFVNTDWYKTPVVLVGALMCLSQSVVTYYYPPAPWLYPFVFAIGSTFFLKMNLVKSLVFTILVLSLCYGILLSTGLDKPTIISATFVSLFFVAVLRSTYAFEIRNFVLNQENKAQQDANLELQQEFSDRITSFIPTVIARRIQQEISVNNSSVSEASINVLRPKELEVSCLFSDIRGFTQGSKQLNQFINESVLPELKMASEKIEEHDGIPRKIGDLIFAYYDHPEVMQNVVKSVLSGIELSKLNEAMNETLTTVEIQRYILISTGTAIVGNLGGSDANVEITALGSPVNFLSRLDDSTKEKAFAAELTPGDLIICERTAEVLTDLGISDDIRCVDLHNLGVRVRDFPETKSVFVAKPTLSLKNSLAPFLAIPSAY